MHLNKLLLFVGLSLITGFIWGYALALEVIYQDKAPHYSAPKTPIGQMVSMNVIKNGDEILIYEHYSGELVFEYSKNKDVDKEAHNEYEDLLVEASNKK